MGQSLINTLAPRLKAPVITNASVTLTAEGRAHYLSVQIGRDFGAEVEIVNGLNGKERLVVNPADTLKEATLLHAIPLPPQP